MKNDYKEKWWDDSFIKRLYNDREKPVTVKHGLIFMVIFSAVTFVVCLAGRCFYGA